MIKYKRIIKEQIVILFNENPAMSNSDIQAKIMAFIKGLEPWDNSDIEKYDNYTREMVYNYLMAKRGE